MRKIFFLVAFLSISIVSFAQDPVNFALASNGSSATASSGDASLAIDGNNGTRWESAQADGETWTLNMGQARTFNQIKINWEGAFCDQFTISYSTDGENWTEWHNETALAAAGWQKIYKETPVTAQYIQYVGTHRATGYGQSFWEFEVYYLSEAPKVYTQITPLTIVANSTGYNDIARVIDGNAGTEWQGSPTNGGSNQEADRTYDAWFVVDLGGFYSVDKVDIHFEGACAQDYHIDFSLDNAAWLLGYNYVGDAGVKGRTDEVTDLDNNLKVRYVRFWSTKAATEWGMKIFEFRVYGEEWVDSGDTEAPVMVSAALESATWNSAVIVVSATDNHEVVKYHVVDASHAIDVRCTPTDGKITVSGLAAETTYDFTVTAIDAANNESANTIVVHATTPAHATVPAAAATAPTWPAAQVKAIYSPTYEANCNFQDWGSGTVYTQEEYGKKFAVSGNGYFGLDGFALNCLLMEKLHADIWIADDASLRLVPIYGGAGLATDDSHGKMVNLVGGQWNSIDLTMATDFAGLNLASIFQFKIDNAANLTFWVGNLFFYRETAIVDTEAPTNVQAAVASQGYFNVVLAVSAEDNMGVVNYSVMNGEQEVATGAGASGATVNITVAGLLPNTAYNFSVVAKDDANNAAEAVVVPATTQVAPAPAPTPDFTNKEAVAVFCDALEGAPVINIGSWGQSTVTTFAALAEGDNVCYATNFNYLGWELEPSVNATGMEYLHVDIYAPAMTSVRITPISPGHELPTAQALTPNAWTSLDIALSVYASANIEWNNVFQFKFDEAQGGNELFIDNVYFYKASESTAINQVEAGVKAQKVFENGQLIIIKNGVRYNVAGQVVK